MAPIRIVNSSFWPFFNNHEVDQQFRDVLLKFSSDQGLEADESFSMQNGQFGTTLPDSPKKYSYERNSFIFFIFLSSLLASNLFTLVMRIYKNSITSMDTNIIIIMNSYIYELYNLIVITMVSYSLF